MKFKSIEKVFESGHLCRYNLQYETEDSRPKKYEMVSRDLNISSLDDLRTWTSKTVLVIGISEDNERIILSREFRMALGDWVYNFPSGMIDEGETPTEAAARELAEETGLTMKKRLVRLKSSFNAVGLTNETTSVVLAVVAGDIRPSDSVFEEIEAKWYTKNEVKNLLKTQKMSARAQIFCFCWAYGDLSINKLAEESEDYGDGHLW